MKPDVILHVVRPPALAGLATSPARIAAAQACVHSSVQLWCLRQKSVPARSLTSVCEANGIQPHVLDTPRFLLRLILLRRSRSQRIVVYVQSG